MIKIMERHLEERNTIIKLIENENIDTSSDDTQSDIKSNSDTENDMALLSPYEDVCKAPIDDKERLYLSKIKSKNLMSCGDDFDSSLENERLSNPNKRKSENLKCIVESAVKEEIVKGKRQDNWLKSNLKGMFDNNKIKTELQTEVTHKKWVDNQELESKEHAD